MGHIISYHATDCMEIHPWKCVLPQTYRNGSRHPSWASYQIRKIAGCACAGNAGNDFPHGLLQWKPLACDPGIHHGTCVTHVPWCMSGSLTRGGGENVPGIPGACTPAILRIWQEAHCTNSPSNTETGIFRENSVDAMPVEALSPCVDTPSVAIALKIQDNPVFVLDKQGCHLPTPCRCWIKPMIKKNKRYILCFLI